MEIAVFKVDPSIESNRPMIDFDAPENRSIDWRRLDDILLGERLIADYQDISLSISNLDANRWGFYSVPGTLGLISGISISRIGLSALQLFALLPVRLNGAEYFFLKPASSVACLDVTKSEVIPFRSDPNSIKEIRKYVFNKSMISDPLIFTIPKWPELFATSAVRKAIIKSKIPGFRFTPLE